MTAMAFVAGATQRLIVDSSVIVLPYHHPVVLAKAASTLDLLTGGRVRLSIGVGHAKHEFDALGVPFHERGRVADEYLAAMIELWTSEHPAFRGRYVKFDRIAFEPKPVQVPYPPIWIGGNSRAAMRRAARHDGWFPWLVTADELPGCLDYIRSQPEFAARSRPFDVSLPVTILAVDEEHRPRHEAGGRVAVPASRQGMIDAIGHLQDIGVTWTSVPAPPTHSLAEHLDTLHRIAEEIIPAFR
jgi:probable F420-dependent oxidoreductase